MKPKNYNAWQRRPRLCGHELIEQAASEGLIRLVRDWLGDEGEWVLGVGGIGDALITFAGAQKLKNPKVIMLTDAFKFIGDLAQLLGIPTFLWPNVTDGPMGQKLYEYMSGHNNYRCCTHLPDALDYGQWLAFPECYYSRMSTKTDWRDQIGQHTYQRPTVVVCPSGSVRSPQRQRYLSEGELFDLIFELMDTGYDVLLTGTEGDRRYYSFDPLPGVSWLSASELRKYDEEPISISLQQFLQYINGCCLAVSTDTWLKTYTCLVGIDTICIKTRSYGRWLPVGGDPSDPIFLSEDVWPTLSSATLPQFLTYLRESRTTPNSGPI